ncbi:acyltransferase family protein [Hymenobacter latericus]|uniref:acyltransferase family protein n=1 Tax=Hymenobacter sp. YIM 151858-1 TaxID=2987688 RepID=UPI002227A97F|nr:acyltransferase [Hymenobacter sp. YIM 151858-1]UYZ60443.1 acyltransferase [Hymenobacter sp. YIM 151858-1]
MPTKPYYHPLTGLRAVAALLVYLHHYNPGLTLLGSEWLYALGRELHVGVTVFFTLSGFLITTRYYGRVQPTRRFVAEYLAKRFARIYPLYFLLTTALYATLVWQRGFAGGLLHEYWLNISFLRGFSYRYFGTGLPQGWSLTVEESFYGFALVLLPALQGGRRTRLKTLLLCCLGLPLLGVGLVVLSRQTGWPYFENLPFVASYTFLGRFFEFLAGCVLALWLRPAAPLRATPWLTYLGVALCGLGVAGLMLVTHRYRLSYGTAHPLGVLVNNVFLPLAICATIAGLLTERSGLARLLGSRVFGVLGKSSYALYLVHMGFTHSLLAFFDEQTWPGYLGNFALLLLLSIGLYYLVEQPANRFIRSLISHRRWPIPTSASNTSA